MIKMLIRCNKGCADLSIISSHLSDLIYHNVHLLAFVQLCLLNIRKWLYSCRCRSLLLRNLIRLRFRCVIDYCESVRFIFINYLKVIHILFFLLFLLCRTVVLFLFISRKHTFDCAPNRRFNHIYSLLCLLIIVINYV